jgi:PAS domain S-box-containing protein
MLRSFLDRGPVVAFIKDDAGRYVYINPAMEQLFGVTAEDIQGQGTLPSLPEHLAAIVREHDLQALSSGLPVGVTTYVDRNGVVEHWKVTRFPFSGPDGTRFLGGLAMNVSDLQDAQAKLAESEHRYRHLVESAQGLICTHDMEGRLLTVNQAALTLTGMTAEQVIGRNLRAMSSPSISSACSTLAPTPVSCSCARSTAASWRGSTATSGWTNRGSPRTCSGTRRT